METSETSISERKTLFAELVLPVPIPKLFTYRVPFELNDRIKTGQRAIVQFGNRKILTGIVFHIHEQPPKDYEAKYLLDLLDEAEVVGPQQFALYGWIADYYMCTLGEVFNAALPSGLKLSSESMVQLNPAFDIQETEFDFSEKERVLIQHLQSDAMSYSEVTSLLLVKNIYSLLKSLTSKGAVILYEQVKEKYKPKTEKSLRLTDQYVDPKQLEALFAELSSKPKQEAVVLKYLQLVPVFTHAELNKKGVPKSSLIKEDISESSLGTLVKNKVLEEFEVVVPRFGFLDEEKVHPLLLSEKQEACRNQILAAFEKEGIALLHGVTGSGKTEIYVDLIRRALDGGNQVLYLLPEIALSTQIVRRLRKTFGSTMGVYHSKFSDNERVEVWNGVLQGKFKFVVGVRSAVFLPFENLSLIIVDEEHDPSYKQYDPAPRYHARDVALVMAQHHHARVLLGSATPSIESFYQCTQGKYGLVLLPERFGEAQLPEIRFANLLEEKKRKMNKGEFTSLLLKEIHESLASKEQVIIFQNRRGYSPMIQCQDCSWIPKCINCAVSLTYHQYRHALICHYCGYREDLPTQCPTCSSRRIQTLGYGTEKLEEELKLHFPDASIQRMDLDTTRTKGGYDDILQGFETGAIDILVGTQMVTKGLDFDRVSLVGVFDADRMMHFPDFRSHERAFQLMTQVSGRSGRRARKGRVIIQTSNPDQSLFSFLTNHDVRGFAEGQMQDRQLHNYPPFSRLIEITTRHTDRKTCQDCAQQLTQGIRQQLQGIKVLGPSEPIISKIRNEYLMTILLKIARNQGKLTAIKSTLHQLADQLGEDKKFRNARIVFDVDPV